MEPTPHPMTPTGTRLLLTVDDEPVARALGESLAGLGWSTVSANGAERALATLGTHDGMRLDAAVLNVDREIRDPASLVRRVRQLRPQLPVIITTAGSNAAAVVDAIRAGAVDYLLHPVTPLRLLDALDRALDQALNGGALDELSPLSERLPHRAALDRAVGSAPPFRAALAIAAKAARARGPVLIGGERGTGNRWLASAIHAAGPRARGPFVSLALDVVAEDRLDRVLFGHRPGEGSHGAIVDADGGTLHLTGLDRLTPSQQARLVALLDEDEVVATGSAIRHRVDVRVIAGHDGTLGDAIAEGRVREDLFHKLAATTIDLPPLRDRPGDLPALTRDTLRRIGALTGARPLSVTDGALSLLRRFDWPGNIAQLETALFRAAALANGDALTEFDFPALHARLGDEVGPARVSAGVELFAGGELRPLADIEADVIRLAINHYGGRMSEIARRLAIGRSTLYRKLAELGIESGA